MARESSSNCVVHPSFLPSMGWEPGNLLVASISEALSGSNKSSGASTLPHKWFSRTPAASRFKEAPAQVPALWQQRVSPPPASFTLTTSHFSVRPRGHHHTQITRQIHHYFHSQAHLMHTEASRVATLIRNHVLPKFALFAAAHHALKQHLERSSHWRPRMPHFRRHRDEHKPAGHRQRQNRKAMHFYEQGLAAERECRLEDATEYYRQAAEADPTEAEYFSRWSKQLSDRSYMPDCPPALSAELNRQAIELGLRSIQADPNSPYGYVACCISRGRLALLSDNKTKAQLAKEAQDDVKIALKLDPQYDIALHLLGRWHYEMAGVHAIVRTLIRFMYGAELMAGSYSEALQCFQSAASICPNKVVHRVEIGRTYAKLNEHKKAIDELEHALTLDIDEVNAMLQKQIAQKLLVQLKQKHQSGQQNWFGQTPRK